MRAAIWSAVLLAVCLKISPVLAETALSDPLNSVVWEYVHEQLLNGEPVVFDDRVRVFAPDVVEDGRLVPVSVRADGLEDVRQILVLGDLNPIPRAVLLEPLQARPFIALRMKVNEGTAIRAAVKTGDGVWHLGGTVVQAPGGGCAAPRLVADGGNWEDHLGEVRARAWRTTDGSDRLRLLIHHPMDTGLVDNIPEFYLDRLTITNGAGEEVARLQAWSALSTNPVLTLEIAPGGVTPPGTAYTVRGADSDANEILARIPAPTQTMPPPPLQETTR